MVWEICLVQKKKQEIILPITPNLIIMKPNGAYEVQKHQDGKNKDDRDPDKNPYVFREKSWKCNLFVHDVLHESGIKPPLTSGGWPITASMWKDDDVPGFSKVDSQQKGDVVSDGVHCGIAIDSHQTVIGAGQETVNTKYPFYDGEHPTIQRYEDPTKHSEDKRHQSFNELMDRMDM